MLGTKDKGAIGQLAVAQDLIRKGASVFMEYGDNGCIDLIAVYQKKLVRIQVKSVKVVGGAFDVSSRVIRRGRIKTYNIDDFDLFAVYLYERDEIFYVPISVIMKRRGALRIRLEAPRNNQCKGIIFAEQFKRFVP